MTDKLKNILSLIVALLMMISNANKISAAPNDTTNLKVGYIINSGFVIEDWNGHFSGYGYEYMQYLANYGHWTFEYVPYKTWLELGEALRSGEVDIIPSMPGNYQVFSNVIPTEHVVGRFPMELVISDSGVKSDMRLGNLPTSYPVPALPIIAEDEGFQYELITYDNYYDMIDSFDKGEIDGYIDALLNYKTKRNILSLFNRQSYRLVVRSRDTELFEQLNRSMDQMLLDQPNLRNRLTDKYLRNSGFPLILTRQEREYLQERKKLKAAVAIHQKPYTYFEDGEAKGAMPEIVGRIASDLGVEVEIVETKSITETRALIKAGEIDFVVDAVGDHSEGDQYNIRLTQPYFKLSYVPLKRSDDLHRDSQLKVACVPDFVYTKVYIEPRFPNEQRLYFPTVQECFKAVSDGRADIVFAPRGAVPYMIDETGAFNLETPGESYFSDEICLGVYKYSDYRLWHILNKEINHLDDNFIRSAVSERQVEAIQFSPQWLIYHHPAKVIALVILIFWIIGGIVIYRNHLRRKHIEVIRHMAYTDARYNLPNLAWLESQMPQFLLKMRKTEPTKNTYVVVLGMQSKSAIVAQYGEELLIKHMQNASKQFNQKPWVAMTAAGMGTSNLICICKAESDAQIMDYVMEALPDYSCIETKDSRIWLHMKAGICEYKKEDLSVRRSH